MQNPVAEYRELNSLTQLELASRLGVTSQVIHLAEAGVYPPLPPKLRHAIHLTRPVAAAQYHAFQVSIRQSNRPQLEEAALLYDSTISPVAAHPHTSFRLFITDSFMGYCKILAIHPQIVRNYEQRLTKRALHPLVKQYLQDAGLPEGLIEDL